MLHLLPIIFELQSIANVRSLMFRHCEIAEVPHFHIQRDVLSNDILRSGSVGYGLKTYSGFHFLLSNSIKQSLSLAADSYSGGLHKHS